VELTRAEIDAFLDERHTLVLATLRPNGTAHLTTIWYRWDGEAFWIATNRNRAKYRHIRRDPRVSALVDDPERETSVSATGQAEIAAMDDEAYDGALAIVSRYVDDGHAYLSARAGEPRVLLRIRPDRTTSWKPD
jgi:PPOX class probable F420-dependent enzyme